MKVIIVNWVYNSGSTGYILRDLCTDLRLRGIEAIPAAATTLGNNSDDIFLYAKEFERRWYHRAMRLGWPLFWGSSFATFRLIKFIKKNKPDLVHLHVMHMSSCNFYLLLEWLGKNNIKTVITHHAELYYTGSCGYSYSCAQFVDNQCRNCGNKRYATGALIGGNPHRNWLRMKKVFSHFNNDNLIFTSVSPWVKTRSTLSPICKQFDCEVVLNGIETSIFHRVDTTSPSNLLFVSANFNPANKDDVKGGWYLVELAKMLPKQQFLVVATSISHCENLPSNIHIHGKAKDQKELALLYSKALLTILTSRRETFSMICPESLCCGTPVVGFKAGGPETIAMPEYSAFVESGDLFALKEKIEEFSLKQFNRQEIASNAQKKYSKGVMTEGYLEVYYKILKR